MKHWYACLFVLGTLVLVSCSSQPVVGKPSATPATNVSPSVIIPSSTPTPVTVNLTPLSLQEAWGNVQISQFSLDMGDRFFAPGAGDGGINTITDDDQMCGKTLPMQSTSAEELQDVGALGLINLHTGKITLLTTLPPGYQVEYCTVTGVWVIWTQVYGNTLESFAAHWLLQALNRQTGEIRTLDQSQASTGPNGPASIQPKPIASNGNVVWTTYSQDTPGSTQSEMYTFATGAKTVLAPDSSGPLLSWPWVSWGDGVQKAIVFKNLETGQQVLLPMRYPPTTVAFAGTSFAFTNSDYSTVTLYPSITATPLISYVVEDKSVDGNDFSEFPSLNSRLVSWSSKSSLVFDRKLMRQVKMDDTPAGFNGEISSHYLVSASPLTQADYEASQKGLPYHHVIRIIDTSTLP
jgi:hypothetical protein